MRKAVRTTAQADFFAAASPAEDVWARPLAPRERLFFALAPDPLSVGRIVKLNARLTELGVLDGKPWRADKFHITLEDIETPGYNVRQLLDWAQAAADRVRLPAFTLRFGVVQCFARNGAQHLVLKDPIDPGPVTDLYDALFLSLHPEKESAPTFAPHLTIAHGNREILFRDFVPLELPVSDFLLLRGLPGEPYEVMGRWPLIV